MLADFLSVHSVFILGPSVYPVRRILVLTTNCQWAMPFTTIFIFKFCSNSFNSLTKWMPKSENVLVRRTSGFNVLPAKRIEKFKLWVKIHGQKLNSLHIHNLTFFLISYRLLKQRISFFLFTIMFLNETNLVYQSTASVVLTWLHNNHFLQIWERKNKIIVKKVQGHRPRQNSHDNMEKFPDIRLRPEAEDGLFVKWIYYVTRGGRAKTTGVSPSLSLKLCYVDFDEDFIACVDCWRYQVCRSALAVRHTPRRRCLLSRVRDQFNLPSLLARSQLLSLPMNQLW